VRNGGYVQPLGGGSDMRMGTSKVAEATPSVNSHHTIKAYVSTIRQAEYVFLVTDLKNNIIQRLM